MCIYLRYQKEHILMSLLLIFALQQKIFLSKFLQRSKHQRNKFPDRNYDYKSVQCNTICACDFQPDKKTNLALNLFMCYHVFAQIQNYYYPMLNNTRYYYFFLCKRGSTNFFPKDTIANSFIAQLIIVRYVFCCYSFL